MNRTLWAIIVCLPVMLRGQDPGQPPGFEFPAQPVYAQQSYLLPPETLSEFRRNERIAKIRAHGWQLLRAVTRPAARGSQMPVWLSWCTKQEILDNPFACVPGDADASKARSYGSVGILPSKAEVNDPKGFARQLLASEKSFLDRRIAATLVSSVHMDPNAARRFQQPALKQSALLYKAADWPPSVRKTLVDVRGELRVLDPFPERTIIVKPSWVVVRRDPSGIRTQRIPV